MATRSNSSRKSRVLELSNAKFLQHTEMLETSATIARQYIDAVTRRLKHQDF
jgi:hypothetical protein